jgi:membrane protein HdeD
MWNRPGEEVLLTKFSKFSKIAGIVFMLLGAAGIIFPMFMTFAVVALVAFLMLTGGIVAAYFTWMSDRGDWVGWLKSFVLIAASLYLILYPGISAAAIGLLLTAYFFIDAFSGFALTASVYPGKGWFLWLINSVISLVLGVLFLAGWPFSSMYLVGLFVGISLLFDGLALFVNGFVWGKTK